LQYPLQHESVPPAETVQVLVGAVGVHATWVQAYAPNPLESMHSLIASHTAHDAPLLPHCGLMSPGWQVPVPSQQPLGQLLESHPEPPMQTPPVQV